MCNLKHPSRLTIALSALLCLSQFLSIANADKPIDITQYNSEKYQTSTAKISNGDSIIEITQVKNVSGKYDQSPYVCRAWFEVSNSNQPTFTRYFEDIDPVGFSYGLFVPDKQPPRPYLAVVKNGSYDGRLYLIHENGEVFELLGGFYFITSDKRFLFSQYASDTSGLAVFDLKAGKVVFSSDRLLHYQHQWYKYNNTYFFTASEWKSGSGSPIENLDVAYFYDSKSHSIRERTMTKEEAERKQTVDFDYDPRDHDDCNYT